MPTAINSPQEFKARVKDLTRDQLLIFHSSQTNPARVNQFNIIARATALSVDKPLDILTINIDMCRLDAADVTTYQIGLDVITCTTVNDGVVTEKVTEPFESTLVQMVRNILR